MPIFHKIMDDKLYYISDQLQDLIDWENIMKMDRHAGGHDEQMIHLFKGSKLIAHYNEGNWQGTVATCVRLDDGRFVIYNDYYGSCSGCDAWEGATDEEVRTLCIGLANGAYIFETLANVIEYLESEEKSYEWDKCGRCLLTIINKYCFTRSLKRIGFEISIPDFGEEWILAHSGVYFSITFPEPSSYHLRNNYWTIIYHDLIPDCLHGVRDKDIVNRLSNAMNKMSNKFCEDVKDKMMKSSSDSLSQTNN